MRIHITDELKEPLSEVRVGNVYPVRGGSGAKLGRLMIVIAVTEPRCGQFGYHDPGSSVLMLIVRKDGSPWGVTHYGLHAIEAMTPIAFVHGLGDLDLTMSALP